MDDNLSVPVNFLLDNELSLQAVGLLCYLKAIPNDENIKKTEIYNTFPKNKKTSVANAWNELVRKGYIIQFRSRKGGKWDYRYFFKFKPFTEGEINQIRKYGF